MNNNKNLLTATEVLDEARRLGAPVAMQTFWKYIRLGLLPRGRKIRGRGNCVYHAEDTPERLREIIVLTREGMNLSAIASLIKFRHRAPIYKAVVLGRIGPRRVKKP